jgi:hypothetical protein
LRITSGTATPKYSATPLTVEPELMRIRSVASVRPRRSARRCRHRCRGGAVRVAAGGAPAGSPGRRPDAARPASRSRRAGGRPGRRRRVLLARARVARRARAVGLGGARGLAGRGLRLGSARLGLDRRRRRTRPMARQTPAAEARADRRRAEPGAPARSSARAPRGAWAPGALLAALGALLGAPAGSLAALGRRRAGQALARAPASLCGAARRSWRRGASAWSAAALAPAPLLASALSASSSSTLDAAALASMPGGLQLDQQLLGAQALVLRDLVHAFLCHQPTDSTVCAPIENDRRNARCRPPRRRASVPGSRRSRRRPAPGRRWSRSSTSLSSHSARRTSSFGRPSPAPRAAPQRRLRAEL